MLRDDWFVGVVSVCLYGGCLAAFDIVGINKLLLGGERFCDVI